jgi:hypothetical protein
MEREQKINKRRAQVEHLVKWQRKLDKEEEKLRQMEQELLGDIRKITSPRKKKKLDDVLNSSIEMVKSIDRSLKILDNIEPSEGEEIVDVSGAKLNKLWYRLTGDRDKRYEAEVIYNLSKQDFAHFYEDAKEFVLQSDLQVLLETSIAKEEKKKAWEEWKTVETPVNKQEAIKTQMEAIETLINPIKSQPEATKLPATNKPQENPPKAPSDDEISNVSTMNSIANIETEEEFAGSYPETFTPTQASTENDDDLRQILANQMKVFIDQKTLPKVVEESPKIVEESPKVLKEVERSPAVFKASTPTIDNATFQVQSEVSEDISSDMEIEPDSLIQTEPLLSIDNSAVDEDGSIIPEIKELQITDMDDENQLIEDISFPDFDISGTDQHNDSGNRNDLSTITECTEYEQSHGSSDEISSEVVSQGTTSEKVNSEIEKRLISINDSLEEVNEAFKKAITHQSSSTVTYSTDKDFEESPKTSTEGSESQATSSTPKILMPDILSEVSGERKTSEESNDF